MISIRVIKESEFLNKKQKINPRALPDEWPASLGEEVGPV